jgi:hypothetical protein
VDWKQQRGQLGLMGRLQLVAVTALAAMIASSLLGVIGAPARPAGAALVDDGSLSTVLIGRDDDNQANPLIQPVGVAANQSLNNTDVMTGRNGNDVLLGLLGSDVMNGGPGDDILVGGIERGSQPNSDVMFGDFGNDISLWQGGDGSDAFIGGQGLDAQVFGTIDNVNNVPTLTGQAHSFPNGIPTANVSGQGGFCTIERVTDPNAGYEFLARFFSKATGNLLVTIRLSETEQVFCTNQTSAEITYVDLRDENPQFRVVSLAEVAQLNPTVAAMIR